jgi:flagellar basal-body rod protein FlgF
MENAGYVGLAYQVVLQRKMELVSNNIANMDTTGYKSQHARFKEYLSETDPQQPLAMVQDYAEYKNFSNGALTSTGNPLDIALVGNGFLGVKGTDGQDYFTRNGRMQVNNLNQLVTSSGELVQSQGGQPITIPDGETNISIAKDGSIVGKQGLIGQFKVVSFADPQSLTEVGNSLFKASGQPVADPKTEIQQGYVEGSNVNPISEMTTMMSVQRAYEGVARMLQNDHDRQRDAIRKLSQTN